MIGRQDHVVRVLPPTATANVFQLLQAGVAVLLLASGSVQAVSFLEDFESYDLGGFDPDRKPDQDWYDYSDTDDVGAISDEGKTLSGLQWMGFQADEGIANNRVANFELAAPTKLTELSFELGATTITDDGVGSEQVVSVQSSSPRRTMAEFYVFCTDPANPSGCELRVRFEHVDSTGQVLIPSTLADSVFAISIYPNWANGTYNLWVDGVDDGTFPFLELPGDIGRIRIAQHSNFERLSLTLDNLFIDGAQEATAAPSGDAVAALEEFATDLHFTTPTSLFMMGLVFFGIIVLGVALPMLFLGRDNSVFPALVFFLVLVALWLVYIEWWPSWIGIALIIAVSAILGLVVREYIMGIKDASTNAGLVAGSLGYFIIATALLGFSGYATESVQIPNEVLTTGEDQNETAEKQSFTGAVTECLVTFFSDCSRETVSNTWSTIVNVASTIFNFARTAFTFLFQLLSFQLPIPVLFNVIIVLPPAAALATVGFGFITRSGS